MESLLPGMTSAPNLHPMVVHFPIAFWVAATAAWSFALLRRSEDAWRFGLWLHTLGLAGGVVAVLFGFLATAQMGHETPGHDLIHVHRNFMLVAGGLSVLVTGVGWWRRSAKGGWRPVQLLMSVLLLIILILGGDRGAELVFRYGIGTARERPPAGAEHEHGDQGHSREPDESAGGRSHDDH